MRYRVTMTPDSSGWAADDLRWVAGYHLGLWQEFDGPGEAGQRMEDAAALGWAVALERTGESMGTWIADIDGTLALKGDRSPYDWARVGEDKPNPPVVAIVRALICAGHEVRYVSGRMEQCRDATVAWLREHVMSSTLETDLHMRPDGDFRPDDVLKREIFEREFRPGGEVAGVIDDRAKVVRMWRDLGLTCVQVAPGEF